MYSGVETHLQMKTTAFVDIFIKSNSTRLLSEMWVSPPFPLPLPRSCRCLQKDLLNFTCSCLAEARLSSVHLWPQLLSGISRNTLHLSALTVTRFYGLKAMAAGLAL